MTSPSSEIISSALFSFTLPTALISSVTTFFFRRSIAIPVIGIVFISYEAYLAVP